LTGDLSGGAYLSVATKGDGGRWIIDRRTETSRFTREADN
jgi:hypothetical protein